jgi:hypothetical protein
MLMRHYHEIHERRERFYWSSSFLDACHVNAPPMKCKRPREENRERTTNRIGEQTELKIGRTGKKENEEALGKEEQENWQNRRIRREHK